MIPSCSGSIRGKLNFYTLIKFIEIKLYKNIRFESDISAVDAELKIKNS